MLKPSSTPEVTVEALENFRSLYETTLRPRLAELEIERKKIAKKIILASIPGIAAGLTMMFFNLTFIPLLIIIGLLLFYHYYHAKEFREKYKHRIIRTIVTAQGLQYQHNFYISEEVYMQSKLFLRTPDSYKGDDYVSGMIGKTAIYFCELFTQYKSGHKHKTTHTIFRGIFFMADFNKNFIGETIVLPDVSEKTFGSLGIFFQKLNISRPPLVKLEDVEFEKHFVVYGTDQVETRYILSPALMQRILALRRKTNTKVSLSFIQSYVYIAISFNKSLFEATSLFHSVDNYRLLEEYNQYIALCVEIVEVLDLNTRIWTKE